ncbi:MAG: glycosyl transferase [Kordia sp.]|nr:MAG: glycosyl transferase [Kordia sp.]
MLSILIPIYNYDVVLLIKKLQQQITSINSNIEIICCDDCSSDKTIKNKNAFFLQSHQITLINNKENIGRTRSRQLLANKANYEWILFLDSDVLPATNNFLLDYVNLLNPRTDCIYGGICYQKKRPEVKQLLRWRFGNEREDIQLSKRNTSPYKSIASGNLLIKKNLFLSINKNLSNNWYGYDNFFSSQLKEIGSTIIHINNKVFHLGLEDNATFLRKKELAANTIYQLYLNNHFSNKHDNGLLNAFLKLNKYRLTSLYCFFYKYSKKFLKKNLTGNNPNLFFLDLYRLGYFCSLSSSKNA